MSEFNNYHLNVQGQYRSHDFRKYTDPVAAEIRAAVGEDADVQIRVKPVRGGHKEYSVQLQVAGPSKSIVIEKAGAHVLSLLKKVKRLALRKLHEVRMRRSRHPRLQLQRVRY